MGGRHHADGPQRELMLRAPPTDPSCRRTIDATIGLREPWRSYATRYVRSLQASEVLDVVLDLRRLVLILRRKINEAWGGRIAARRRCSSRNRGRRCSSIHHVACIRCDHSCCRQYTKNPAMSFHVVLLESQSTHAAAITRGASSRAAVVRGAAQAAAAVACTLPGDGAARPAWYVALRSSCSARLCCTEAESWVAITPAAGSERGSCAPMKAMIDTTTRHAPHFTTVPARYAG